MSSGPFTALLNKMVDEKIEECWRITSELSKIVMLYGYSPEALVQAYWAGKESSQ